MPLCRAPTMKMPQWLMRNCSTTRKNCWQTGIDGNHSLLAILKARFGSDAKNIISQAIIQMNLQIQSSSVPICYGKPEYFLYPPIIHVFLHTILWDWAHLCRRLHLHSFSSRSSNYLSCPLQKNNGCLKLLAPSCLSSLGFSSFFLFEHCHFCCLNRFNPHVLPVFGIWWQGDQTIQDCSHQRTFVQTLILLFVSC